MRLIDADALMPNAEYKGRYDVVTAYDIANAPTIELQRKGKWIVCGDKHVCSECDEFSLCDAYDVLETGEYQEELSDFCPNCGADMRGEEE